MHPKPQRNVSVGEALSADVGGPAELFLHDAQSLYEGLPRPLERGRIALSLGQPHKLHDELMLWRQKLVVLPVEPAACGSEGFDIVAVE